MFDSTTTYVQGETNVGTTQYDDAYQRANFWGSVQTNTDYHLLLSPTVLSEVTLSPPPNRGKTGAPFGETVAEVDINWIDGQFQTIIANLGLQSSQLPIFMTYQTYLTPTWMLHRRLSHGKWRPDLPALYIYRPAWIVCSGRIGFVA
jgi:hypothetical protein